MAKYVYYEPEFNYGFQEIEERWLKTQETLKKFFGKENSSIDKNNEIIIYKLVPYKVLKKEVGYKVIDINK